MSAITLQTLPAVSVEPSVQSRLSSRLMRKGLAAEKVSTTSPTPAHARIYFAVRRQFATWQLGFRGTAARALIVPSLRGSSPLDSGTVRASVNNLSSLITGVRKNKPNYGRY